MDSQPLSKAIWDDQIPGNFKPSLVSFNGKNNPYENVITINNQMEMVRASDSLKCKFMTASNMEKRSRDTKGKLRAKKEGAGIKRSTLSPKLETGPQ